MNKILIIFLSFFLMSSCAQNTELKKAPFSMKRRNVEEYFVSTGALRYFLPELPVWANFSEVAQCRRAENIKFLDMGLVRKSLDLNYEEAIQLQLLFNTLIGKLKAENHIEHIPFKDEEKLFFQASDQIQADVRAFRVPRYEQISLIWIDSFIDDIKGLKSLLKNSFVQKGHPVFISLCHTQKSLTNFMERKSLGSKNIRKLTYELLSPYDESGELAAQFKLYIDKIFGDKKSINLFIKKGTTVPNNFIGQFKTIKM